MTDREKIDRKMRDFFRSVFNGKAIKSKYEKLLGYSIETLKIKMEMLYEPGMSHANHGVWHVDHIHERVNFNYSSFTCPDFFKCYSLRNLQPLWASENMSKNKVRKVTLTNPY